MCVYNGRTITHKKRNDERVDEKKFRNAYFLILPFIFLLTGSVSVTFSSGFFLHFLFLLLLPLLLLLLVVVGLSFCAIILCLFILLLFYIFKLYPPTKYCARNRMELRKKGKSNSSRKKSAVYTRIGYNC